jgi:3-methyladenine DNA glycosylase AlkD
MLDEREFFIRKAIGWVLREVSKKRPALTYDFLLKHRDRVSRLSLWRVRSTSRRHSAERSVSPGRPPGKGQAVSTRR